MVKSLNYGLCGKPLNKRAKMALDLSPEFLRGRQHFFLPLSEKNLQAFLHVRTEQLSPIH